MSMAVMMSLYGEVECCDFHDIVNELLVTRGIASGMQIPFGNYLCNGLFGGIMEVSGMASGFWRRCIVRFIALGR